MIPIFCRLRAANSARLFYTLTMAAMALFTKAGHDFMARTVYRLTQKSLLYQAGTRRKLLMDTGTGLTGDTMAAMQPWRFLQKRAMILWQGRFIALRKNRFSIRLVLEENY